MQPCIDFASATAPGPVKVICWQFFAHEDPFCVLRIDLSLVVPAVSELFRDRDLTFDVDWPWNVGSRGGPRAGVDGRWRLCCGEAVEGPFADGSLWVFQRSLSFLVQLDTACEV